jgi:hypothetical protein
MIKNMKLWKPTCGSEEDRKEQTVDVESAVFIVLTQSSKIIF